MCLCDIVCLCAHVHSFNRDTCIHIQLYKKTSPHQTHSAYLPNIPRQFYIPPSLIVSPSVSFSPAPHPSVPSFLFFALSLILSSCLCLTLWSHLCLAFSPLSFPLQVVNMICMLTNTIHSSNFWEM